MNNTLAREIREQVNNIVAVVPDVLVAMSVVIFLIMGEGQSK